MDLEPPQPIGRSTWYELYPEDIAREKWRSCVCSLCTEVEDLLNTWGAYMSVVHANCQKSSRGENVSIVEKSDVGRRVNLRCNDAECRWGLREDNPASLPLPAQWPSRFKNIITDPTVADSLHLQLPTMFCTPCGCGCCVGDADRGQRLAGEEVLCCSS